MKIKKSDYLVYGFSLIIALFIIHFSYGLSILNPSNINWLMSVHHDWGTHYLGWAFYREDPWTLPLGYTESYNYPLGTNVGFTDTIPLLAFVLKPFSFLMSDDFQYFGFWLFLCHYLTAVYTFKIFNLYNIDKWFTFFAVVLVAACPVLLIRCIHPALSSHFLIVASIYNYLKRSDKNSSNKININQIILFFLAGTINPYISVMIFGFNLTLPLKHYLIDKSISFKKLIIYPIISITLVMLFWIVFGMVEIDNNSTNLASAESFNLFSFNLNSFYNSYGYYSKFFPDLGRTNHRQFEGFSYLGLGMMIILFSSIIYFIILLFYKKIKSKTIKRYSLLFLLCLGMLLFALTNELSYGTNTILKLPLPKIIEKLGFIFRASGRFVWPMYYCIFLFSLLLFSIIKINKKIKIGVILLLTSLQLYDIQNLFSQWNLPSGEYDTPLSDQKWISVMKEFDNIIIYPPFTYNYSMTYNMDYQDICFLALKAKKPISNGYVARTNIIRSEKFKIELIKKLNSGEIDNDRLFITTPEHIGNFDVLIKKKLVTIKKMDKFIFIYSNKHKLLSSNFEDAPLTLKYIDSLETYYIKRKIIDFKIFKEKVEEKNNIQYYLDDFKFEDNTINIHGWAFLKETNNNKGDSIYLSLTNSDKSFIIPLKVDKRIDITEAYKKEFLDDSGFYSVISLKSIPKSRYDIGIIIKNKLNKLNYVKTDKIIEKK